MRAQFFGHGAGQSIQTPLRGGIGGSIRKGVFAGEGRDVDNVSASPGIDHEGREAADAVVDATQIGIEHTLPILGRKLMERAGRESDSGIVDQDVDAVEGAIDEPGESFDGMEIGNVAFDHGSSWGARGAVSTCSILSVNGSGGLFESGAGASAEDSVGAELREFDGDGLANASSGAGDDSDLPAQRQVG
jgi:hypothetical protein